MVGAVRPARRHHRQFGHHQLDWRPLRFTEVLGAIVDGDTIANIDGNGFDIVYNPLDEENAYLLGRTYQLAGGGLLVAVPEPAAALLFLPALVALLASTGRRKAAGSAALPAAV